MIPYDRTESFELLVFALILPIALPYMRSPMQEFRILRKTLHQPTVHEKRHVQIVDSPNTQRHTDNHAYHQKSRQGIHQYLLLAFQKFEELLFVAHMAKISLDNMYSEDKSNGRTGSRQRIFQRGDWLCR